MPQKINYSLINQKKKKKKELNEAEKLKVEAKNLLSDYESKIDKSMHDGTQSVYYVLKMFLSIFVTLLRKNPRI